jgi:uncharacterized protein (DUF983 family)
MKRKDLAQCLQRGFRKRCPSCGETPLFSRWNELHEKCASCGCALRAREGDTWFFMDVSTAAIPGLFVIAMFLFTPTHVLIGRIGVGVGAFMVFILSTERRKGIAIAVDYYIDKHSEFPRR